MIKKYIIFTLLFHSYLEMHAACPCDATSPTYTSSAGTDAGTYTVNAGQKLYIPAGSTVTGTISLINGGTIVNLGIFSPSSFTWSNGTIDNCGSVTKNITVPAASTFNNCSNGTITGTTIIMGNTAVFNNSGIVDLSGSTGAFTVGNMSTMTNSPTGSICVGATFTVGNASTTTNNGVVACYDFVFANAGTFTNNCNVVVTHNLTISNTAIIAGPTAGSVYGRFTVSGTASNTGATFGNTASDKLDLCRGGCSAGVSCWTSQTGTVGAGVTYCANSGCTSVNNCGVTLPVKLLYFKPVCIDKKINLKWSTATETNNDFFTIERSEDGLNYQTIAIVDGAGNSTHVLNYSLDDETPLNGISYYRLKQTDFDGKFSYSDIVSISCTDGGNSDCNLYHINSTNNTLSVNYTCIDYAGLINVQLINMLGQLVFNDRQYAQNGNNTFEINTEGIAAGMYILKLSNNESSFQKKFIK